MVTISREACLLFDRRLSGRGGRRYLPRGVAARGVELAFFGARAWPGGYDALLFSSVRRWPEPRVTDVTR